MPVAQPDTPPARAASASESTKTAIREAATRLFAERGFTATSVRDIAQLAGANQALVIRYFGSKEALFIETMSAAARRFEGFAEPPLDSLGRTIVERLVHNRADPAWGHYTALMRAVDRPDVRGHILRATTTQIVEPLAELLTGPDKLIRAHLIAAQVTGLLNELWILEQPELVRTPPEKLIKLYGDAIQAIVDAR
jgi:AcrR family transcriptional regulator